MKIFFYKTLLVAFVFFIVFKLTIGSLVKEVENKIYENFSKENIERVKDNLRKQIIIATEKERYIKKSDADLINALINKVKEDLKSQK